MIVMRGGHVAADGVPGHGDPARVEVLLGAVRADPFQDGVDLLDSGGVLGLGRQAVVDEDGGRAGACGEFPDQPVVGVGVAKDPAGAVRKQHDGHDPS